MAQLAQHIPETTRGAIAGDLYGGIGVVAGTLKSSGYSVVSADQLLFPTYFQTARLAYSRLPSFQRLRNEFGWESINDILVNLNTCENVGTNWFAHEYSSNRKFFKLRNAERIQASWNRIRFWDARGLITRKEKAILLASLIDSMDRVANTAGTYYAYLKDWTRKALLPFEFKFLKPVRGVKCKKIVQGDALDVSKLFTFDLLYLDPPYNGRNYSRYYHLPETLAHCEEPIVRGVSGMPARSFIRSDMYSQLSASTAIEEIVANCDYRKVMIHYSASGVMEVDFLRQLVKSNCGKVYEYTLNSLAYTSTKRSRLSSHVLLVGFR